MLEYCYIENGGLLKIYCSGYMPNFEAMGITAEVYRQRLHQHDAYVEQARQLRVNKERFERLFTDNMELFLEHYQEIVNEPRFANILVPYPFFGAMYVNFKNRTITLGELLRIYKNESAFSAVCPNCGGRMLLISFGFSPLSGSVFPCHCCCGCQKTYSSSTAVRVPCSGNALMDIRNNYSVQEPNVVPTDIFDLLAHLGKPQQFFLGEYSNSHVGGLYGLRASVLLPSQRSSTSQSSSQRVKDVPALDLVIPEIAWTDEFASRVLMHKEVMFGNMPPRFKTTQFLTYMLRYEDWKPKTAEIPPKLLTAEVCVRAIKCYPHRQKSILKHASHLADDVIKIISQ